MGAEPKGTECDSDGAVEGMPIAVIRRQELVEPVTIDCPICERSNTKKGGWEFTIRDPYTCECGYVCYE